MNKLTIIGNLTSDPELRTIPSGVNVCTFTVAVNRRRGKEGEQTADFVEFLSPKTEQGSNYPAAALERPAEAPAEDERGGAWAEITDGDLPF